VKNRQTLVLINEFLASRAVSPKPHSQTMAARAWATAAGAKIAYTAPSSPNAGKTRHPRFTALSRNLIRQSRVLARIREQMEG
jgi:hypothetical protein